MADASPNATAAIVHAVEVEILNFGEFWRRGKFSVSLSPVRVFEYSTVHEKNRFSKRV